jgi:hypothetical protein
MSCPGARQYTPRLLFRLSQTRVAARSNALGPWFTRGEKLVEQGIVRLSCFYAL